MKTLSRFLFDHTAAVLAPKLQQTLFHHVRLSLASGDAAAVDPTTTPYHSDLHWHVSTASRRIFICAPPVARHSCATAGPTRAPFGVAYTPQPLPIGAIFMRMRPTRDLFDRRNDLLESTESCRSVCLGENTDLSIVAMTTGFAAPDLVARRSRPRCKSPP